MDLNQTKPKRRTRSKTDQKTLRGRSVWIDETGEITGKKGTKYSEVSTTIPFGTGWITAPTIDESGNKLSDEEVKQRLKDNQGKDFITGEKLPVFSSEEKASEYAQWRSNTMFDKEAIEEGFPEETFPDLPEDKKEKSKEGETSLKGFIDYLMSPSRHFGTGQYNEGGAVMNDQMEMAFMQEGGIIDDDLDVDPVSGNEVPPGSLSEEVRDDIPAQLSEGEYVVPADVVRYYGVKFFEDLRDQAKMGLAEMEADGRIGGEPVPDGGPVNDKELSEQEMAAIREVMGMTEGGEVQNPYLQQQQLYSQPRPAPIDEKRNTTITNVNPVENQMPMQSMASGGQVQGYDSGNPVTQPDDDIPPFAKNEFNPAQFGLGFSFMGQPQQTGTTETTATFLTLYGPEGQVRKFRLPLSQEDAAEVARLRGLGYSETPPADTTTTTTGTPGTDTTITTDLTGATVTTGGSRKKTQVEADPNAWMEKFDYTDMSKLGSQTSELLNKSPMGSVMGAFSNASNAAQAAANIIIMDANGASKEEVAKLKSQYQQFLKDSKLEYIPKGLINGDRLAKDIVENNIDVALFKDSTDPFGNRVFKEGTDDFEKFVQKVGPKGRGSKGIKDAFARVQQRTKDLGTTSTGRPPQRPDDLVTGRVDSKGFQAGDPEYTSALKQRQLDKKAKDDRKKYQKQQREKMQKKNVDFTKRKLKEFKKTGKVTGFDKGGLMNKKGKKK